MKKLFGPGLLFVLFFGLAVLPLGAGSTDVLPPDQAFRFSVTAQKPDSLLFSWEIADGTYLYRHKFKFVSRTAEIKTGVPVLPRGELQHSEYAGDVDVFRHQVMIELPLLRADHDLKAVDLSVSYQGCADEGVCYLPVQKSLSVNLPERHGGSQTGLTDVAPLIPFLSEQDRIAASLGNKSLGLIIFSFIGFGLLLALTPCVFPMIPILSGIIIGQGERMTGRRAFGLSLTYVLASALAYMIFGILAGMFGGNLQAFFQQPWVIMALSGIFVWLGFSMFGTVSFRFPVFMQTGMAAVSAKLKGGSLWGASAMGMVSAFAVGPCVTPPLAGALIYIGQSGDAVLGGVALFSLGLGMGIPLLIIGTSAGKLLPKAGAWMKITKAVFGVGLFGVAVWLLGRILPMPVTLVLWVFLLMIPLFYLGWRKLWMGVGLVAATYGILVLVGIATHHPREYLQSLCNSAMVCEAPPSLPFQKINTLEQLQQKLATAHAQGHPVMLDFYADWCESCQQMQRNTFADPEVIKALSQVVRLQADVTQNSKTDQALLRHFELIGPPAVLFFGSDKQEHKPFRIIGFMKPEAFLTHAGQALK
jgi:thiol:disulfide interchange protein DsbD